MQSDPKTSHHFPPSIPDGDEAGASPPRIPRLRGYFYILLTGFVFLQAGLYASHSQQEAAAASAWLHDAAGKLSSLAHGVSTEDVHPITHLMDEAERAYRAKLERQSTTLAEAVAEYTRRYRRAPPKGFDRWWTFAQENGVRLVDEYDAIARDLDPFWALTGAEFRRRTAQAGEFPTVDIVQIRGGKLEAVNPRHDGETSGRSAGFIGMISKFAPNLPDMDFAINGRVESRVLIPYNGEPPAREEKSIDWHGEGSVWSEYRQHCAPGSAARSNYKSMRPAFPGSHNERLLTLTSGMRGGEPLAEATFVDGTDALSIDYCAQPWAHQNQGLFFSDWRTIGRLVPILSSAKAPGFSDIKVPSHYYYWPSRRHTYGFDAVNLVVKEMDNMEVPWDMKREKIFWRGATSGGGASPPGYAARYHRHRLMRTAHVNSTLTTTIIFANASDYGSHYIATQVPLSALNKEIMDTAFVKAIYENNYPDGVTGLQRDHRFINEGADLGMHWRYKYLLDLDGMGYSGKFMALMESDSAVMKATVYEEFWSDWIQPWLHFIPLSSGYHELYNIHAYFSGPSNATLAAANATDRPIVSVHDGDLRLRRIARAGKQWRRTVVRNVDIEGRRHDPSRDNSGSLVDSPTQRMYIGYAWNILDSGRTIVGVWNSSSDALWIYVAR